VSSTLKSIRLAVFCCLAVTIVLMFGQTAQAVEPSDAPCNVAPAGVISADMAEGFRNFWPLYTQIAALEGVDPVLIAPIHYREHFGRDNPKNGQGIFQLYSLVMSGGASFPSTNGDPVSDEDFIHQGRLAVQVLKGKTREHLSVSPDPVLVKQVYYGYNGRNSLYASQARPGEGPWDGSPYVMNVPGMRELTMMTQDGGGGPRRLDPRPGAFPIYEELVRQCSAVAPVVPQPVAEPPATAAPQTAGYDFANFIDSALSNGGNNMKEFQFDYQPMHFGGEVSLLIVALFAAVGVAYLFQNGKWRRPGGMLVLATLAAASLSAALLADKFGTGWQFEMFGHNLAAAADAVLAWVAYPDRVATIKLVMTGMFIAFGLWFGIKCYKSGKGAPGEVVAAFKPLMAGSWKLLRRALKLRHAWLILAAVLTLMVAATRLNTDVWAYGSTAATIGGLGLILWLNKKSVLEAQDVSE